MDALAALSARIEDVCDQPFAVLDFDNTCIVNDIGEATLAFMCRKHLLRCGELLPSGAQPCSPAYHEQVFRHYHQLLDRGDIRRPRSCAPGYWPASDATRRQPPFRRRSMRKEPSRARPSSTAF